MQFGTLQVPGRNGTKDKTLKYVIYYSLGPFRFVRVNNETS